MTSTVTAATHEADLDIRKLVLDVVNKNVRGLDTRIDNSLTDGTLERTMDGASTLTLVLDDPHRALLRSGVFAYALEVQINGIFFRLAKVAKQADQLTLTFEDRAVAYLRQYARPRKANRANVTRAEFALSLVREVKQVRIPFVSPSLHAIQQIDTGGTGLTIPKGTVSTTKTKALPYQFRRGTADGARENSWTTLQRLAQEVNWRCFVTGGTVYFASDTDLLKAPPRLIIDENSRGVLGIDFDLDAGKPVHECTVTARANRWSAPPGSVVSILHCGPANGKWLVADISRGVFDAAATIQLRRASKALPEPAPDTQSITSTTSKAARVTAAIGQLGSTGSAIDRAYQAAQQIDAQRYPYVWGGGHGAAGTPSGGPPVGYDCSGSTCAVLAAGGMGFRLGGPVDVSGAIASSWGVAGEGAALTVWANAIHVWMEFKIHGDQHFGTGNWGKGWGGAGFNPSMHPKGGFTPRHWPGL